MLLLHSPYLRKLVDRGKMHLDIWMHFAQSLQPTPRGHKRHDLPHHRIPYGHITTSPHQSRVPKTSRKRLGSRNNGALGTAPVCCFNTSSLHAECSAGGVAHMIDSVLSGVYFFRDLSTNDRCVTSPSCVWRWVCIPYRSPIARISDYHITELQMLRVYTIQQHPILSNSLDHAQATAYTAPLSPLHQNSHSLLSF